MDAMTTRPPRVRAGVAFMLVLMSAAGCSHHSPFASFARLSLSEMADHSGDRRGAEYLREYGRTGDHGLSMDRAYGRGRDSR